MDHSDQLISSNAAAAFVMVLAILLLLVRGIVAALRGEVSNYTAFIVGLLAVSAAVAEQRAYPVHSSGAILVTGASSGIGRDAALALDALGFTVYAGVRRDADARSLTAERTSLRPILLDVAIEAQCTAAAEKIASELGEGLQFVGLVNNAGVSRRLPLELEDMAEVRKLYDVNVFGLMAMTQAFTSLLRRSSGRIVNIGSVAGILPHKGSVAYGGSKAALEVMTDVMRLELAPWDISVSLLEPAVS
jgi:NAD(P)-dependent dehydrogenase (short-subunit alcohol dehydrogenase family)